MIKSSIILWLCPLLFFLSFPSISKTNANIELTWDQLYKYVQPEKDYNKIYNDLINRVNEVLGTVKSPEKRSQLSELLEKPLEYILKWGNKFGKSIKFDSTFDVKTEMKGSKNSANHITTGLKNVLPKSITDVFNQVKVVMLFDFASSAVETGLMIYSLSTACDEIKKSEQFRKSAILQEKIAKSIEHLDNAKKFYRAADNEMNEIEIISDISIKENVLEKIALKLERAQLECERAQEVLKNILNDIHQTMEKLLSAKKSHIDGLRSSLLRLAITVIEFFLKPISSLANIVKLFFATNVSLQTVNTVGYGMGFCWTQDEIQKLEEHQHKLDILETKMKDSFAEINYGMKKLEKLKQYYSD